MEDSRTYGQINGNLSINTQLHKIRTGNKYVPEVEETTYGLTKREYFAGLAMQSLVAMAIPSNIAATRAVNAADDLLEELQKPNKNNEQTTNDNRFS